MVQKRRLAGQGGNVGSETSEQVMALLNELSALKELNKKYEGDQSGPEKESHLQRQQRQTEITEEIKTLAERKKSTAVSKQ
jgi:hypothetical protein